MHRRRVLVAYATVLMLVGGSYAAGQAAAKSAKKKPAASKKQTAPAASKKKSPSKTAKGKTSSRRGRKTTVSRRPTGPTRERIQEIQAALIKSGHYRKEPTGQMDATTVAALGKFQEDNGLERTGKLNVWTLRKLEQYGLPATSRLTVPAPAGATAAQANPSNP